MPSLMTILDERSMVSTVMENDKKKKKTSILGQIMEFKRKMRKA